PEEPDASAGSAGCGFSSGSADRADRADEVVGPLRIARFFHVALVALARAAGSEPDGAQRVFRFRSGVYRRSAGGCSGRSVGAWSPVGCVRADDFSGTAGPTGPEAGIEESTRRHAGCRQRRSERCGVGLLARALFSFAFFVPLRETDVLISRRLEAAD